MPTLDVANDLVVFWVMDVSSTPARDAGVTRNVILHAALELFADQGFELVGVRAIGAKARIDPSLINRYFGSKDDLFVEVIRSCSADWKRLWGDREGFPERVVEETLRGPKGGLVLRGIVVMLRSSGSEHARLLIDKAVGSKAFSDLEEWVGGPEADVRARLLIALLAGMAFARDLSGDFALIGSRADALDHHLKSAVQFFLTPQTS